jgi:hypothetical protein
VPSVGAGSAFVYELVLTAILMFDFWVYLAGPVLGAAAGAFADQAVRGERETIGIEESPERDGAPRIRLPA